MASEAIVDRLAQEYQTESLQHNPASTTQGPDSERGISVRGGRFNNSANANNNLSINLFNLVFGGRSDGASSGIRTEFPSLTYSRLLLSHACGFPLYDPQPPGWLSAEYRREGVRIGDVGIVHTGGYFDFLFNIRYPADHEVNGGNAPEGFSPPAWASSIVDVSQTNDTPAAGTYFLNGSIEVSPDLPERTFRKFSFRGKPGEGALLVLPSSTVNAQEPLVKRFRDYAGENALSWYEFATGPLERDLSNGSIYLITGWEKTSCWGTASFQGNDHEFSLSFENTDWASHGVAAVHRGPRGRTRNDEALPDNQCIFLKGYKATIGKTLWERLQGTVDVTDVQETNTANYSSRSQSGKPSSTSGVMNQTVASWFYGSRRGPKEDEIPVEIESINMPTSDEIHPSNLINRYLLDKVPDAKVAVTHDDDWCSLIKVVLRGYVTIDEVVANSTKDSGRSFDDDYFDSVFEVVNEGGMVFLDRKEKRKTEVAVAKSVDQVRLRPSVTEGKRVYKTLAYNSGNTRTGKMISRRGITSLPPDVLVFIFLLLDFRSILSFSSTCRTLLELRQEFQAIEYSLMLDSCSLINNSSVASGLPLCRMTIMERLASLKAREEGWSNLKVGWEQKIDLQRGASGIYDLADGVYVFGDIARKSVHWVRLADESGWNIGKATKWNTIEFNGKVVDVVLNVYEHDLLAALISHESPNDPTQTVFSLHFLSLSQSTSGHGVPHPEAQHPILHIHESPISKPIVGIDIVGRHLAITTFYPDSPLQSDYHIHFIEWKTGRVKLLLKRSPHTYCSLVFLTEDVVLIPNVGRGCLDIWLIPEDGEATPMVPIRSLALPELAVDSYIARITCRCWPNPVGSTSVRLFASTTGMDKEKEPGRLRGLNSNRPFHANPEEAIVVFNIGVQTFGPGSSTTFSMFMHRRSLLELAFEQPNDIPDISRGDGASICKENPVNEERDGSDNEESFPITPNLNQYQEDQSSRPTNNGFGTELLGWEDWGGPNVTRWFVSEEVPARWITTSAGQRAVIYEKESGLGAEIDTTGNECVVKLLDFSPVRIKREECLVRRREEEKWRDQRTKEESGMQERGTGMELHGFGKEGEARMDDILEDLDKDRQLAYEDNAAMHGAESSSRGAEKNSNYLGEGGAVGRPWVSVDSAPIRHTPTSLLGSLSGSPPRVIREPSCLVHEMLKEPIISHLPYTVVETRKLPKFAGVLMDEERLIGLSMGEDNTLKSVWVIGIGASERHDR